jgi:hypothetical protein
MPNHHCLLRSLKHRYPETAPYQDSLVNRYKDPGAGAFSYSRGREFTVIRDVPAGGELFLNYGVSESYIIVIIVFLFRLGSICTSHISMYILI